MNFICVCICLSLLFMRSMSYFFVLSVFPVFFDHYVTSIFRCSLSELLAWDAIAVNQIKKLPSFYASLLRVWLSIKGGKASGIWVIPCSLSGEPLPLSKITAKFC